MLSASHQVNGIVSSSTSTVAIAERSINCTAPAINSLSGTAVTMYRGGTSSFAKRLIDARHGVPSTSMRRVQGPRASGFSALWRTLARSGISAGTPNSSSLASDGLPSAVAEGRTRLAALS
jgi:hypothetical protein